MQSPSLVGLPPTPNESARNSINPPANGINGANPMVVPGPQSTPAAQPTRASTLRTVPRERFEHGVITVEDVGGATLNDAVNSENGLHRGGMRGAHEQA